MTKDELTVRVKELEEENAGLEEEKSGLTDEVSELEEKLDSVHDVVQKTDGIMEKLLVMDADKRWDERSIRDLMDAVREYKGLP